MFCKEVILRKFTKYTENTCVIEHLQLTASDKISKKFQKIDGCLLFIFLSRMETETAKLDLSRRVLCNAIDIQKQPARGVFSKRC